MRTIATLLFVLGAVVASAQPQVPEPSEQRSRLKALDYMAGEWTGSGWIAQGGPRQTFSGGEVVQRKLAGVALLVEGRFMSRPPGAAQDVVSHETLGVISFDPQSAKYKFKTYLATGLEGEYELDVVENGWRWGFQTPAGEVRYSMTLDASRRWVEKGEIQIQGVWRQFFEMTLEKKAP